MLSVGSVFSGCGMLDYGLHCAGLRHEWFCEVDPFRRQILAKRWPGVPIFGDIRAVDARAPRPRVIAGGFPCKGGSTAGKREGFGHPETVLWREMRRVVGELEPEYVVVENVANLLNVGGTGGVDDPADDDGDNDGEVWAEVLADLASLGFDVVWDCFPAAAFGAPHLRDRVLAVAAHADRCGRDAGSGGPASRTGGDRWEDGQAVAGGSALAPEAHRQQRASEGLGLGVAGSAPFTRPTVSGQASADADIGGRGERAQRDSEQREGLDGSLGDDAGRRGVAVDWCEYGPAIERWELVHGPAPLPLVRRMDDGAPGRVERSRVRVDRQRLSALGDGVQAQLGMLVGAYLMNLDREAA